MANSRAQVVSSFMVIKGAQLEPTYRAFTHWDLGRSKKENLDHLKAVSYTHLTLPTNREV